MHRVIFEVDRGDFFFLYLVLTYSVRIVSVTKTMCGMILVVDFTGVDVLVAL